MYITNENNKEDKLSKDFSLSSNPKFKCGCCGKYILNELLLQSLQELRDLVGVPIEIFSGYRCESHNKKVGGSKKSQHIVGNAADIYIPGYTIDQMIDVVKKIEAFKNGGIGRYPGKKFIHVDVRPNGPMRW